MTMGGNGMGFEEVYALFMINQLKTRKGEAKRRLKEGHGHAEKLFLELVWWPIFRHFDYLFPEFEVRDFQDGYRYLDFAFIYLSFRVCFEIDGFGPHSRDMNRRQFAGYLPKKCTKAAAPASRKAGIDTRTEWKWYKNTSLSIKNEQAGIVYLKC
jgi:hypothetical protein